MRGTFAHAFADFMSKAQSPAFWGAVKAHGNEAFETFFPVVQFGCLLHCIHEYGVDVTMCVGPSMLPTFSLIGDVVIMERITPKLNYYSRGDVVIATSPTDPKQTVCKRIRAIEGDTVTMNTFQPRKMTIKVPKGHVWLEGDNSTNSTDSR